MPISIYFLVIVLSTIGILNRDKSDPEKERAALLEIHSLDRRAHFDTSVDLLLKHAADEFIYVGRGKISRSSRAQMKETFADYFKNAKYYEWDDLEPPIIKISDDASMAWMIVRTKVRRTQTTESGEVKETAFIYAGIMTYEKKRGKWIRIANVSTFE